MLSNFVLLWKNSKYDWKKNVLGISATVTLWALELKPCIHRGEEIWKRNFIPTSRPTVDTHPHKLSTSLVLVNALLHVLIWKRWLRLLLWMRSFSKTLETFFSPLPAWKRYFQVPLKKGRPFASQLYYFSLLLNFFQVSRLFYDWHEALKVARKHKELTDGQMIHHNRRVKRGCMQEWKKFTLKSRAEKHCNKTVTSKVWICYSL